VCSEHDLDLARLAFLKDALVAEYNARIARWHAVQAALLAVAGLAALAWLGGTLAASALVVVLAAVGLGAYLATKMLDRYENEFELKMQRLLEELETLKRRGGR
jgi:hypothetical protein